MLRSTLIAAGFVALAAPAFANTFTVETVEEKPASETFIAEKAVWSCEGTTCTADLNRKTVTVRTCKKIVKEAGPVKAFTNGDDALSAEELEKCNAAAK